MATFWENFSAGDGASCSVSTPSITCDPVSCDLDCHGTGQVTLSVTGGVGPYSWETTKGQLSAATGSSTTLSAPTNPWSGASGTNAYGIATKYIATFCTAKASIWDCYGNNNQTCQSVNSAGCWGASTTCSNCTTAADAVCDVTCTPSCSCGKPQCADADGCPEVNPHKFCGLESDPDCQPCAISMQGGAVVTVTDALGQSAFVTITVSPRTTI